MDEVIFRLQNYYIIASDILLLLLVHSQPEVSTYLYKNCSLSLQDSILILNTQVCRFTGLDLISAMNINAFPGL